MTANACIVAICFVVFLAHVVDAKVRVVLENLSLSASFIAFLSPPEGG